MFQQKASVTEDFVGFFSGVKLSILDTIRTVRLKFRKPEPVVPPTFGERCSIYIASYDMQSVAATILFVALLAVIFSTSRRCADDAVEAWFKLVVWAAPHLNVVYSRAVPRWAERYCKKIRASENLKQMGAALLLVQRNV